MYHSPQGAGNVPADPSPFQSTGLADEPPPMREVMADLEADAAFVAEMEARDAELLDRHADDEHAAWLKRQSEKPLIDQLRESVNHESDRLAEINAAEIAGIEAAGSFVGSLSVVAAAAEARRQLQQPVESHMDRIHADALREDQQRANGTYRPDTRYRKYGGFASSSR